MRSQLPYLTISIAHCEVQVTVDIANVLRTLAFIVLIMSNNTRQNTFALLTKLASLSPPFHVHHRHHVTIIFDVNNIVVVIIIIIIIIDIIDVIIIIIIIFIVMIIPVVILIILRMTCFDS